MDDWVLLTEAAKRTGLSPVTLRDLKRKGRLPAERRGRDLWVRWADVQQYLANRTRKGRYREDVQADPPPADDV